MAKENTTNIEMAVAITGHVTSYLENAAKDGFGDAIFYSPDVVSIIEDWEKKGSKTPQTAVPAYLCQIRIGDDKEFAFYQTEKEYEAINNAFSVKWAEVTVISCLKSGERYYIPPNVREDAIVYLRINKSIVL